MGDSISGNGAVVVGGDGVTGLKGIDHMAHDLARVACTRPHKPDRENVRFHGLDSLPHVFGGFGAGQPHAFKIG